MNVKYLRGTRAQFDAYLAADKLVSYYYYLITEKDGSISLYLGDQKLNNVKEIEDLEASLGVQLYAIENNIISEKVIKLLKDNNNK